jgi:pre-mRNA-processing factor 19
VAKISGLVFERRLITKYIAEHGKCPVTGETLAEKDLVEVKAGRYTTIRVASVD